MSAYGWLIFDAGDAHRDARCGRPGARQELPGGPAATTGSHADSCAGIASLHDVICVMRCRAEENHAGAVPYMPRALPPDIASARNLYFLLNEMPQDDEMICALAGHAPRGFVLAGAQSPADIDNIDALLRLAEAQWNLADGRLQIVVMIANATALCTICGAGAARHLSRRIVALGWDADALARNIGAGRIRNQDGDLCPPFDHARAMVLMTAKAACIAAIDTPEPECAGPGHRDPGADDPARQSLERAAGEAAQMGFDGKFATAPAQLAQIDRIFAAHKVPRIAGGGHSDAGPVAGAVAGAVTTVQRTTTASHTRPARGTNAA